MTKKESAVVFALGATVYPLMELLTRKRTHWSMSLAGGVCFSAIFRIHAKKQPLLLRCALGAACVTGVELITGLVVNRLFDMKVWDYSKRRFNVKGQICPLYTGIWFALCASLDPFCRWLRLRFSKAKAVSAKRS